MYGREPRQTHSMSVRVSSFWQRISDGVAIQQLWSQFHSEARASYRLYSKEVDWTRSQDEKRGHRAKRVVSGLFWAMVMKLSPARRVVFVIALILLVFPGFDFQYGKVDVQLPNLSFFGAVALLILLALELADRVTMKRDLEIAKEIQTWLMPAAPPEVPGLEMAFATRPANTVAGDYYDAFLRPSSAEAGCTCSPLLLVVADVAGKSVPAALLMATLQASLRTLAGSCTTPLELIERLNQYCCEQNIGGKRFTTAFLAELDPTTRLLTYINAGHNWPVLRRASGTIERLQTGGMPLGLMRNARYESDRVSLAAGDQLVVFTDGLVEAENDKEEEYGEGRMLAILFGGSGRSAAEVLQGLMTCADQFTGSAPQHDDITCLVLRVLGG
ncbi:MAG: serine/threonine-protein phosphatase [Acidobacteriaceae bacterium]|nr:serine/threonine-protein phosphatase [Acidobacteriaceae bacterium]